MTKAGSRIRVVARIGSVTVKALSGNVDELERAPAALRSHHTAVLHLDTRLPLLEAPHQTQHADAGQFSLFAPLAQVRQQSSG